MLFMIMPYLIINTYVSLMYELKKMERYLRVSLLGPGPRLKKNEFTGTRSHKGWETLAYMVSVNIFRSKFKTRVLDKILFQWLGFVETNPAQAFNCLPRTFKGNGEIPFAYDLRRDQS